MSLKCLFGHKWNGCKCERCGKKRDEGHNFVFVDKKCVKKCSICGKEHTVEHDWNGCKCEKCGEIRNLGHKWQNNKCLICEKENQISVEKLRKLHTGMKPENVKIILGNPNFINSGANAMKSVLGGGQIIGGAGLSASMQQKEYWLYETSVGNFQILIDNGRVTAFSGLDYNIEKLEKVC